MMVLIIDLSYVTSVTKFKGRQKKKFKASWTKDACKRVEQKLHNFIKEGGGNSNHSPYLNRLPLAFKRNQEIAMLKLKVKKTKISIGYL